MRSLEGRKAVRGRLGLSQGSLLVGSGLLVLTARQRSKALILGARVQTKDPRRRGLQGTSHRAEFWVNRTQDLLPPRRIPASLQTSYKKYLLSVNCTKDKTESQM